MKSRKVHAYLGLGLVIMLFVSIPAPARAAGWTDDLPAWWGVARHWTASWLPDWNPPARMEGVRRPQTGGRNRALAQSCTPCPGLKAAPAAPAGGNPPVSTQAGGMINPDGCC
ncbi:MAG: hypothetical protein M3O15_08505 [Acidobacteriota bacterium]|nr:hypothetical protein [Acidobacteriota bacterium]